RAEKVIDQYRSSGGGGGGVYRAAGADSESEEVSSNDDDENPAVFSDLENEDKEAVRNIFYARGNSNNKRRSSNNRNINRRVFSRGFLKKNKRTFNADAVSVTCDELKKSAPLKLKIYVGSSKANVGFVGRWDTERTNALIARTKMRFDVRSVKSFQNSRFWKNRLSKTRQRTLPANAPITFTVLTDSTAMKRIYRGTRLRMLPKKRHPGDK
ncbi:unnamed protein product, partial [Amoebophrya sp. A25]